MQERFVYLISFSGELSVKGRLLRRHFTNRLQANLRDALSEVAPGSRIEQRRSRLMVESPSEAAGEALARVFGVRAVSRAVRRPWRDLDDLLAAGEEAFRAKVSGRTFSVRARRGGQADRIPFRSPELERRLGHRLLPWAAGVDLRRPEVEARVELHGDRAYFFAHSIRGHGGLPVGTEGRALALVSGGFDSAVAAWLMLRRGVRLDYIFFNLGGDVHRDGVLPVLKVLADRWSYGYRPRLHVVDFRPVAEEIRARTPGGLWQILLKRQMLRVARGLAAPFRAAALVTGEAVGQVSSQTLKNLGVIESVSDLPVLRPLLTWNKEEILDRARRIGTHDLSAKVPEYCGLGSSRPESHASSDAVAEAETALAPGSLSRLVDERAVLDLRALDLDLLSAPDLAVERPPPGARLVDLRSQSAYRAWHPPGAEWMPYADALRRASSFDAQVEHVFYCEIGLKSAHVAEVVTAAGGRAYHLEGGLKALRRPADPALAAALSPAVRD